MSERILGLTAWIVAAYIGKALKAIVDLKSQQLGDFHPPQKYERN